MEWAFSFIVIILILATFIYNVLTTYWKFEFELKKFDHNPPISYLLSNTGADTEVRTGSAGDIGILSRRSND